LIASLPEPEVELPAPRTDALDTSRWPQVLRQRLTEPVCFAVLTHTRVDTGFWVYRPRLWAWVSGPRLTLWAWGEAAYEQTLVCNQLLGSFYNHVTGHVALADRDRKVIQTLKLRPEPGYQLLAQIYHAGKNARTPTSATNTQQS